ncbi:uncharacterized protein LOC121431607 isoform X2 [Lytechinus variegatus]|uniref:uncharacterized protein LOC121431607 isoform X2 n=1 Tax=Lytechinus variegatus TaxID=7654 RepID=UPI001BB143EA|nr:uncharacterized protein LOC121431607 isoform X2 [Lytechinus variegatus]
MATLRLLFAVGLPVFCILIVSCQASDCPYGEFYDNVSHKCAKCSRCPANLILSDIYQLLPCYSQGVTCPDWCPPWQSAPPGDDILDACFRNKNPLTTTPTPAPSVNVTKSEPKYNATANRYSVMCTVSFINMPTPTLEWFNPSGQLLAPTDTWGEATTQEIIDDQEIVSTLLTKEFEKDDEGQYTCVLQGVPTANQTVFLQYVDPPTSPPTTPSTPGSTQGTERTTTKPGESNKPKDGYSKKLAISIGISLLLSILLIVCAYFLVIKRRRQLHGRESQDYESHPLTGNDFKDGLILETSDFKSAKIRGIKACLDQQDCVAVIIRKNGNKIKRESSKTREDTFFIEAMKWDDSIEIWMENAARCELIKCFCRDPVKIKTLKMNCLKVSNNTETSVLISCPNVENKFYLRYEEKNSSISSANTELIEGGSREIRDLRPSTEYSVQLSIKGQTGNSSEFIWKEKFSTKGINFKHEVSKDSLALTGHASPASLKLYYELNQAKEVEMSGPQIPIKHLIPGMKQVLKIKLKSESKPLQVICFETQGTLEEGGDFREEATSAVPTDDERVDRAFTQKKKPRKRDKKLRCETRLLDAIRDLLEKNIILSERAVAEAVIQSLQEFFKEYKHEAIQNKYVLKNKDFVEQIRQFLTEFDMKDYTRIFDLLKRFYQKDGCHSKAGLSFAEELYKAHDSRDPTCHICRQALFMLRWYSEACDSSSSSC